MNQPSSGDDDDMERRFQRGLKEDGAPSEAVRRAILEHASRMAVQHARSQPERRTPVMRAARRWSTIFGTLAAAVFAGLLVVPILRAPVVRQQSQIATPQTLAPSPPSPQAAAQAPAPRLGQVEQNETSDSGARAQQQIAAADAKPKEVAAPTSTASDHSSRAKAGISTIARAAPPAAPLAAAPAARDAASTVAAAAATANRNSARGAASLREPGESLRGAAAAGDLAAVNALLGSSSDVDARDPSGRTALMLAILNGHAVVVDALLAHGADGNAVDATGVRPLQMARTGGNEQIIDSLLRAGAR
jgi:hypothetical protein